MNDRKKKSSSIQREIDRILWEIPTANIINFKSIANYL